MASYNGFYLILVLLPGFSGYTFKTPVSFVFFFFFFLFCKGMSPGLPFRSIEGFSESNQSFHCLAFRREKDRTCQRKGGQWVGRENLGANPGKGVWSSRGRDHIAFNPSTNSLAWVMHGIASLPCSLLLSQRLIHIP